jgi:hypothetical protein
MVVGPTAQDEYTRCRKWRRWVATVAVELSEHEANRLEERARRLGIPTSELLRMAVVQLADEPEDRFAEVAKRVLAKNRDLYERLSWADFWAWLRFCGYMSVWLRAVVGLGDWGIWRLSSPRSAKLAWASMV